MKYLHAGWLASLPATLRNELVRSLTPDQAAAILHDWRFWARPSQLPPRGRLARLAAARRARLWQDAHRRRAGAGPRGKRRRRAASRSSRRPRPMRAMSWSKAKAASWRSRRPGSARVYEPSKRRLTWPNGAIATLFSADEPERLRGPQHDLAWCDELAAWRYPEAWDMLMFGLRLGRRSARRRDDDAAADQADPRRCWPTRRSS